MIHADRGIVEDFVGTTRNATSIVISWNSPPCPNGLIRGYLVYYRVSNYTQASPIDSSGYASVIKESTDLSISFVINGLTPSETYAIHVRAFFNESEPGLADQEILLQLNSQVTLDTVELQAVLNRVSTGSRELTIGLPSASALEAAGIANIE